MPRNHSILIGAVFILCFPLFVAKAQQPSITQKPVRRVHEQILTGDYQRWLDEDVRWIITDQERADYQSLKTDQQRDQFVESFWTRRDPPPAR